MKKTDTFKHGAKYISELTEQTYLDMWNGITPIPESPLSPLDCWLVCKPLQEKCVIPGFIIIDTMDYQKDKCIDAVVLASGPGYRVRGGAIPTYYDGKRVLNECKKGDIIHFLDRAATPFTYEGELYYTLPEHVVLFAIDP